MTTFLSPFQQAAEVVDLLGIPAARWRGGGGGGEFLQGFAKPEQEKLGGRRGGKLGLRTSRLRPAKLPLYI